MKVVYCSNSIFCSPATSNKMNTLLASLLVFTFCLSVGEYFTILCQVRVDNQELGVPYLASKHCAY